MGSGSRLTAGLAQGGEKIKLELSWSGDTRLIRTIKWMKGSKFRRHPSPHWLVDFESTNVFKLEAMGKKVTKKPRYRRAATQLLLMTGGNTEKYDGVKVKKVKVKGLKKKLRKFQRRGLAFLESRKGRALLADEMGLGKTCQSLAYTQLHKDKMPVLIVVPGYLKLNWKAEIRGWLRNRKVRLLEGQTPKRLRTDRVYLINYAVLSYWTKELRRIKPQIVIFDEVHYIKNRDAIRTKAALSIARKIPHVIGLTGTPTQGRALDLYSIIMLIDDCIFPSYWYYMQRYCGAKWNGYSFDFTNDTNTEELHDILTKTIMLRRTKAEVLPELPPKTRTVIPLEIDNEGEYRKAEEDFEEWLEFTGGSKDEDQCENKMEALKQLAVAGKMKRVVQWLEDFLESGEKLIVVCVHRQTVVDLGKHFGKRAVVIHGGVPAKKRHKLARKFQKQDKVRLWIANIEAGGLGFNLTAASNVATIEFDWDPMKHEQIEDRGYRIGQKSKSYNCWYLTAVGTVEVHIIKLLDKKRDVFAKLVDGKAGADFNLVDELVKAYK